ncbi:MAG: hypothetical protein ACJA2S_001401 [Cyclobacteriaceae bacterium]|jgi:hypothetical protein
MKFWHISFLAIVFMGCCATQCGNSYYRIARNMSLIISPRPILVKQNKADFDFVVEFPLNKHNRKFDSICYRFLLEHDEMKYIELAKSCHIIYDSIPRENIIRHEDHIGMILKMDKDTLNLYIKGEFYKNGKALPYPEMLVSKLIKDIVE